MLFLRILVGLLGLFFGYFLGRVVMYQRQRSLPQTKTVTWVLRTAVCLAGVFWSHGFDLVSIVFLALTAASIVLGAYLQWRPRKVEQIHLFPDQ